jgi:P4 family phage/plasmid primase-like protien
MNHQSVEELMRNYAVDIHTPFHTHVSMVQPKGRFQFNRQGMEHFWSAYCRMLTDKKDPVVGLAEKPQQYLPVLADIDLKIKEEDGVDLGDQLYTQDHLKQVIQVYQSILRDIVEDCNDEKLMCVLLEKPMYRVSQNEISYVKNGFHLHFCNIFLNKVDQEVNLIPRVQIELKRRETFADIGFDDSGSLVDNACCKVPWLMYGSRKSEEMQPYLVSTIFDADYNEVELEEAFKHYQLFDMNEKLININGVVKENLPRILSIIPQGRAIHDLKRGTVSPLKEKLKAKTKNKKHMTVSVIEALKVSAQLLPILSDFRTEDRNEWMVVGWVLFNIGDGSPEAQDQWLEFSSRAQDSYDEAKCIYEWERMTKKDFTLGTLKYFASVDNPEKYQEFKNKQVQHYIKQSLDGSHNDIAKLMFAEFGTEFVCSSIETKTWYQFRNHRWEEIEDGIFLRTKISDEIAIKYSDIGAGMFTNLVQAPDKSDEIGFANKIKQTQKLVCNLKSHPFKINVMRECMDVFYDHRFRNKLNQNPNLVAFQNGVYDCKLNIFRAGRPEDFISKAIPIEYCEYSDTDEEVRDVFDFLEKVFPDTSVRRYFMDIYSDIFVGGNPRKIVLFWTGEGDNAKSITQTILERMLGELAIKFETTLMSGKKTQSGCAAPELARAGPPIRHATLEEPDNDESLNTGYLKRLSGGDSYWARDLFEKGKSVREVTPMFMLTFICNKLPKLRHSDKATWNRIKVIPFETTFVRPGEPCPETYEEQLQQKRFPMDQHFSSKIPQLLKAFAWVLLEHRKKPKTNFEPEKVREATNHYRKMNDIYRQFIEEVIVDHKTNKLMNNELFIEYKNWIREGFPGHGQPDKNGVTEYFTSLWGPPKHGGWVGYKVRNISEENQDDDTNSDLEEQYLVQDGPVELGDHKQRKPPM